MVSWYFWDKRNGQFDKNSFYEYISNIAPQKKNKIQSFYKRPKSFNPDIEFIKTSTIVKDLNRALAGKHIHIGDAPVRNASVERKGTHYSKYYGAKTRCMAVSYTHLTLPTN